MFIPIETKADRPRPTASGKRAKSVAKRRPSRDDSTGSNSLDKMLRSKVPIDEFDLSPRKVRQASAVEDTDGDPCLPGATPAAQPVSDCSSGSAALGGEQRFAHLIFKPAIEVSQQNQLTTRSKSKVISEEMAERRRLEKLALEVPQLPCSLLFTDRWTDNGTCGFVNSCSTRGGGGAVLVVWFQCARSSRCESSRGDAELPLLLP